VATSAPGPGGPLSGRQDGYHRQIADRNAEAILDAVDDLLRQHRQASVAAVAAKAGVSRVTVYAHYPTSQSLLEAAVERAVRRVSAALESASPDSGPPVTALERMLALAWQHLASYGAMAQAVSEQLSPEAVARTHQAAHQMIGSVLERGRADGTFRTDLPASWLVTACIALVHACADAVRAGSIAERDAPAMLATSVRDLFTGPAR
jgi:TetR/AcrR family transcriptional repressor of mexCD-oprJ operon